MKKLFFIFLITQISFAQKKEVLISKIAEETCECITKKKVNIETTSYNDFKIVFGVCIMESYQTYRSKFNEKDKLDFSNREEMRNFGEEVGLKMIKFCPDFMLKIGEKKIAFDDSMNEQDDSEEVEIDPSVTGTVFQINSNQFLTFSIKETSGRTVEFILLNNFDNSFLLTEKLLKPNDIVDVYYYESELFDAKINKYVTYKVITDIIKK